MRNLLFLTVIAIGISLAGFSHASVSASSESDAPGTAAAAPAPTDPNILIVPGHEPDDGGAVFNTTYERDMVVGLGQDLQSDLNADGGYQTTITRDTNAWNPIFADYFKNDWDAIASWVESAKTTTAELEASGQMVTPEDTVLHNDAQTDVALRLYGITKWADENNVDLMVHIHFNDDAVHAAGVPGKYSGFVIYVPPVAYGNGSKTQAVAQAVYNRLAAHNPVSDLPVESAGIVQDPELIALGSSNTATLASMLIEYDYIYQPQYTNTAVQALALKDLAYQTSLGLQDYYKGDSADINTSYKPETIYNWRNPDTGSTSSANDIYALQTSLMMAGEYPQPGKTLNDCPHSGTFGSCTAAALAAFQKKEGITTEKEYAGPKTFKLLDAIYNAGSKL